MGGRLALILFSAGILGLFYLDRDKSTRVSKALWVPVAWLLIIGSRPVSQWLGIAPHVSASQANLDGSPVDRLVFSILIALGLVALISRGYRVIAALKANWPICLYFAYCLVSFMWSDFPDVSLKRWSKSIGDLVMVLVVATDPEPVPSLKRLLARVGFVLMPASVLVDKYFGDLSRTYNPFSGAVEITGVSTDKNSLGVIAFVLTLGAVWQITELLRRKDWPNRGRHLLAQGTLLAFGLRVLLKSHSSTALVCLGFSASLLIATKLPIFKRQGLAHVFVLTLVLMGTVVVFSGGDVDIVHALGKNMTFTGRTDLWRHIIPLAQNPIVGAGFETFWLGPRLNKLRGVFWFIPNEAHDGYIEVYLQLGWVGLFFIVLILLNGYSKAVAGIRRGTAVGGLALGYLLAALLYNVTEAGFRMLDPAWFFLLLMIVCVSVARSRAPNDLGQISPPSGGPTNTAIQHGKRVEVSARASLRPVPGRY